MRALSLVRRPGRRGCRAADGQPAAQMYFGSRRRRRRTSEAGWKSGKFTSSDIIAFISCGRERASERAGGRPARGREVTCRLRAALAGLTSQSSQPLRRTRLQQQQQRGDDWCSLFSMVQPCPHRLSHVVVVQRLLDLPGRLEPANPPAVRPAGAPAGAHPGSYTTSSAPAAATNEPGRKLPRYTPHKDEDRPLTGLGGAGRAGRRRTQQPDKPSLLIRHMLRTAARRVRSSLAAACTRFSTKTKSCKKHSESENLRHGRRNPNVTWSGSPPNSNQFLSVAHRTPPKNILKIRQLFSYPADKTQRQRQTKQAVGGRPPRYAPPLSSPVGDEAPCAAKQTAT